jgi:hypothetical protein
MGFGSLLGGCFGIQLSIQLSGGLPRQRTDFGQPVELSRLRQEILDLASPRQQS